MATSQEILNDFMNKQNKEFVGEKVDISNNEDKDFLPDREKAGAYDTDYSTTSVDKSYIVAKKTMSALLQLPILFGGLVSFIYILMKLTPIFIEYIRKLLIILSTSN